MLTTDPLHHTVPDQVLSELGQGPATVGQAQLIGRHLGQSHDLGPLFGRQARRGSQATALVYRSPALAPKGVEIGIERVDVDLQKRGDVRGVVSGGVKQKRLRTSSLPCREFPLPEVMESAD